MRLKHILRDRKMTIKQLEIRTLLSRAGVTLMYLPAYGPDLNPIEMMFLRFCPVLFPDLLSLSFAKNLFTHTRLTPTTDSG
ncbi:MAG: transposase [Oscillibacter sp.]|nr:transposase [Oscillibacter sp.]